MRKAVSFGIVLALVTMVFAALPMNVAAAEVRNFGPKKGKAGLPVNIHGEGFSSSQTIKVTFGSRDGIDTRVKNDQTIRTTVPERYALDPKKVKITVIIDGVTIEEDLWFEYDPAGPEPVITEVEPAEGIPHAIPSLITISGRNFTTPKGQGRTPTQIFLIGPVTVDGWIIPETVTDTSFTAEILVPEIGIYEIAIGFSDGSGASAQGFKAY